MAKLNKQEQAIKNKLFSFLRKNFKNNKIKTCNKLDKNAVISCCAIEDADYQEINRFWDLEGNKSYPRDLYCDKCKRQVMLSNIMFKMYNKVENQKPKILCGKRLKKIASEKTSKTMGSALKRL